MKNTVIGILIGLGMGAVVSWAASNWAGGGNFSATAGQVVSCSVDSVVAVSYTVPAGKTYAGRFSINGTLTP